MCYMNKATASHSSSIEIAAMPVHTKHCTKKLVHFAVARLKMDLPFHNRLVNVCIRHAMAALDSGDATAIWLGRKKSCIRKRAHSAVHSPPGRI